MGEVENTSDRAMIPEYVRKTIEHIKEIAGKHSDEDVYAMLEECRMDPNEATQRLLYLDTFHEVKKKRDRKKESSRYRASCVQGRGLWGGRGNYSSHDHDASGGRNVAAQKENGVNPRTGRIFTHSSLPMRRRAQNNATTSDVTKSSTGTLNGARTFDVNKVGPEPSLTNVDVDIERPLPSTMAKVTFASTVGVKQENCMSTSYYPQTGMTQLSVSGSEKAATKTNQLPELSEVLSLSTHDGHSDNWSSSQHESESSPQSVGPSKVLETEGMPEVATVTGAASSQSLSESVSDESNVSVLEEATSNLRIYDGQHVIFRNNFQVPEAFKNGLTFGSFVSSFDQGIKYDNGPDVEKCPTPAECFQENIEVSREPSPSNQSAASTAQEGDHPDHPQSPPHALESLLPPESSASFSVVPKNDQLKQEMPLPMGGSHFPIVQPLPNYNFGFMPPILGSPLVQFEGPDAQATGIPRLPSIVSGNSLVLSASSTTPPATQPAGLTQNSISVSPQQVPVFRPAFPPNYFPFSNYYSPLYMPPAIHQFVSHTGFPQQPPTGNVYLSTAATAAGIKLSHPQHKLGNDTGNSTQIRNFQVGYGASLALSSGSTTTNAELAASQLKENNLYANAQQSEGSGVWIPSPGLDISSMHPPFSPAQTGHGAFAGICHPAQTLAAPPTFQALLQQSMAGSVDMMAPRASGYQQAQHPNGNWNPPNHSMR